MRNMTEPKEPIVAQGCLTILLIMLFATTAKAVTISLMWEWYIVPLGVVPITFLHATGLSLFVSIFKTYKSASKEQEAEIRDNPFSKEIVGKAVEVAIYPLVGLFFGWLVHLAQ